jgi:hypothetical protein
MIMAESNDLFFVSGWKDARMLDAKMFADLITVTRGLLGLVMVWSGLTQGETALSNMVLLLLLCWTGDFVDGRVAQISRRPRRTWIGDNDIYIDLFVSICLGIFLIGAGFVGLTVGVGYSLGWMLVLWHFGSDRNLLMLIQAPIYLWFILTALRLVPEIGNWLVVWVLAAIAINWRRFTREIVPGFIEGMRSLWDGHGKPRSS